VVPIKLEIGRIYDGICYLVLRGHIADRLEIGRTRFMFRVDGLNEIPERDESNNTAEAVLHRH